MAWQRLFCVTIYALALALPANAQGTPPVEAPLQSVDDVRVPTKKTVERTKTAKTRDRIKGKAAATKSKSHAVGKAKAGSAKPAHSEERRTGQIGYASWYGGERHGRRTASGGHFNKNELTAAHRTLPLHSKARVTNMTNGRSVTVRITDRGPTRKGRIIDLSQSAAEQLGMRHNGVARVHVEPIVAEQ